MAEPKPTPEKSTPAKRQRRTRPANLDHRTYYFNRELSWLQFNARVLEEALDQKTPLLERVKFLSIFFSNLDEFFEIRVAGLHQQVELGASAGGPDGMSPSKALEQVCGVAQDLVRTIVRDEFRSAGMHEQDRWNGCDFADQVQANGVYILELRINDPSGENRIYKPIAIFGK